MQYLIDFINKHKFNQVVKIICNGGTTYEHIEYVVFNEQDIPCGHKVKIEDIRYDVLSSFPNDLFMRWIEYVEKTGDDAKDYIYWVTKINTLFEPFGMDKSESEEFRKVVEGALDAMRKGLIINEYDEIEG